MQALPSVTIHLIIGFKRNETPIVEICNLNFELGNFNFLVFHDLFHVFGLFAALDQVISDGFELALISQVLLYGVKGADEVARELGVGALTMLALTQVCFQIQSPHFGTVGVVGTGYVDIIAVLLVVRPVA